MAKRNNNISDFFDELTRRMESGQIQFAGMEVKGSNTHTHEKDPNCHIIGSEPVKPEEKTEFLALQTEAEDCRKIMEDVANKMKKLESRRNLLWATIEQRVDKWNVCFDYDPETGEIQYWEHRDPNKPKKGAVKSPFTKL